MNTCLRAVLREKAVYHRSYLGCVHKVAQSDPGSDAEITGFHTTFMNGLYNESWLLHSRLPILLLVSVCYSDLNGTKFTLVYSRA